MFVPHSMMILGRIFESFINEVISDIPKELHQLLYLLISPDYLHHDYLVEPSQDIPSLTECPTWSLASTSYFPPKTLEQ